MTIEYYDDGTVTLADGSATVAGSGTAWTLFGVVGGVLVANGLPTAIPIEAAPGDTELTLKWPSPVTLNGVEYAIYLVTSDQSSIIRMTELQAQIMARNATVAFRADARGSLAGRDAYDGEAEGFQYGIIDNPPYYTFYEKASDDSADWVGPFDWYGPPGTGAPGSSDVVGTSASSVAIGTGSKSFTIEEANRGWGAGARLRVSSDADATNFMEGLVTAYSGFALELAVDLTGGAGTFADWTVNLAGRSGQSLLYGTGEPSSGLGSDGDHYIDTAVMNIYGPKVDGVWGSPTPIVTASYVVNIDGGNAFSEYGGTTPINGGDAFSD